MKYRSIVLLLAALLLCGCTVRDPNASAVTAAPEAPAESSVAAPVADSLRALRITEIMADNASPYGDFRDWIELTNTGSETVELTDCALSDKPEEPLRWRFPACSLGGRGTAHRLRRRRRRVGALRRLLPVGQGREPFAHGPGRHGSPQRKLGGRAGKSVCLL